MDGAVRSWGRGFEFGGGAIDGELDLAGVPRLRSVLAGLDGDVELDCSGWTSSTAAGLGAVVQGHEVCVRGGKLVLVDPSPAVDRLLQIVELDTDLLRSAEMERRVERDSDTR